MTVIGITLGYKNTEETELNIHANYLDVVREAGGVPLLLPPQVEEENLSKLENKVDGILLSGGSDVNPHFFGEEPQTGLRRVDPYRDKFELKLVNLALEQNIPILALCRGIQVLNIVQGGTIIQHLKDGLKHEQEAPYGYPTHQVTFIEGGYLQQIYDKKEIGVNSFHHQALNKMGQGLRVEASAPDGTVEAVVLEDHPFAVGVQWHPERMYKNYPLQLKLFEEFIRVCSS